MAIEGEPETLTLTASERTWRFEAFSDAAVPREQWRGVWNRGRIRTDQNGDIFGTEDQNVGQVVRTAAQMAADQFTVTVSGVTLTASGAHIMEFLAVAGDYYRQQDIAAQTPPEEPEE